MAAARKASLVRFGASQWKIMEADRELTVARIETYIRRTLEDSPPLRDEDVERITRALTGEVPVLDGHDW